MIPYVTPSTITNFPTGIDWRTVPTTGATQDAQQAAQMTLCWAATHWVDTQCNQPLRATNDLETLSIPGYHGNVDRWGLLTIFPRRWPVLSITSLTLWPARGQQSSARTIDPDAISIETNAGIEDMAAGAGSWIIHVQGTPIVWKAEPGGWRVGLRYTNGWPHAALTAPASVGDTSLTLDVVTGIAADQVLDIDDGAATESVTVSAVTTNDDGITGSVTLSAPLQNAHVTGTPATALPGSVRLATALYASHLVMLRGTQAIAVPVMSGGLRMTSHDSRGDLVAEAQALLAPYARIV